MKARIERCSVNGGWWAKHIGRVITILYTDQDGHWTRDTNMPGASGWDGYPFLQWIAVEDVTLTFDGKN